MVVMLAILIYENKIPKNQYKKKQYLVTMVKPLGLRLRPRLTERETDRRPSLCCMLLPRSCCYSSCSSPYCTAAHHPYQLPTRIGEYQFATIDVFTTSVYDSGLVVQSLQLWYPCCCARSLSRVCVVEVGVGGFDDIRSVL
jgi:hypothetical protein